MLFREHGGGRDHGGLLAVHRRDVGRAHGHFGLAVAGVAADEAVHRFGGGHVGFDGGDGGGLVGRLLVREGGFERVEPLQSFHLIGDAGMDGALGLHGEELGGEILNGLLGVGLVFAPAFAVQFVEFDLHALDAHVAGKEMGVRGRYVEFGAVGVFDGEHLHLLAVAIDKVRTRILAHAIIHVHHVFAGFELVETVQPGAPGGSAGRTGAGGGVAFGEDAIGLGDDDKAGDLEAGGESVLFQNVHAAPLGRV